MGQTITITTIITEVSKRIPGLNGDTVVKAGAANFPALTTSPEALAIIRSIWNTAVSRTMILSVALVAASVPFTFGMEWLNAKKVAESRKNLAAQLEKRTLEEGERIHLTDRSLE